MRTELNAQEWQVKAAIDLLDGGSTVPFIARYRKEVTGTLDDAQLRTLEERLRYLRELEDRRKTILDSVREQGKLTDELALQLNAADTKARLEDLYLPYKPKRRTKAQIAREAGLEPLADLLLTEPAREPKEARALAFVNTEKGVATPEAALEGARSILVERFAENAELLGALRETYWERGSLTSKVRDGKTTEGAKFSDYFDFAEPLTKLPSHRILALFRGEKEEILDLRMEEDKDSAEPGYASRYEGRIALAFGIADQGRPGDKLASRHRALGLAHEAALLDRARHEDEALAARRGRGRQGVRRQPARPAARRSRRRAPDPRPRSGLPHRREGGGGGCDRQGGGDRYHLPARAEAPMG